MKRPGHLMESIASLENLYLAYQKACRGKRRKQEVLHFAAYFDENMERMRRQILDGTVAVGDYHFFTIRDPKVRVICAAPFCERILQHAVINICHPYFDRNLIFSTYATRKGKGIYAALDKAVSAMSHYSFTVKLDFRKYYDSIDHHILKEKLRRLFKDAALLHLFDRIIDSYCTVEGKGLPIGNLASQYFANAYLSTLDHLVMETLPPPVYIRYMDDILMAGNDLAELRRSVRVMSSFSSERLRLTLKPPVFRKAKDGQNFLGYRVRPYHYQLSGRSKRRFRSKLLKYNKLLEGEMWNEEQYQAHILPLLSFAQHAESKSFRKSCLQIASIR